MKYAVAWMLLAALLACAPQGERPDTAIAYVRYCRDLTDADAWHAYDRLAERAETHTYAENPAILPLFRRERALVRQYDLLPVTLRIERFGRSWTGDEILTDPTLNKAAFDALYEAYMARFNAAAGALFCDLLAVRKEIAAACGYDSYAAYAYARFGRDYTPSDAARFCERVKAEIAPLPIERQGEYWLAAMRLYGIAFRKETALFRIREAIVSAVPALSEPWDAMIGRNLYDIDTGALRMPISFATYCVSDGTPFLFVDWTGGYEMPSVLAHTFGQFASLYIHGTEDGTIPADLVEIDAQGLELLTVLRYDMLYGEECGAAETAALFDALYALVDGCAEDAFLQLAFQMETPTVEALNDAYGRIAADYGLSALGVEPRAWTRISQSFHAPFYSVSDAVGMTVALQLYAIGRRDPTAAADAYDAILNRGSASLSETLERAGIDHPLGEGTIGKIALALRTDRNGNRE